MAGMLLNNLLYFNDIYCLSYIFDYFIGNSIVVTFLLIKSTDNDTITNKIVIVSFLFIFMLNFAL